MKTKIKQIVSSAVFLAILLFSTSALPQNISRVDIYGLSSTPEHTVREIIGLKPGDAFSMDSINKTAQVLKKWGIFESVNISASHSAEGEIVEFNLKEARVIAAIDVTGNYPYIENKIRKYLTLRPGDPFTPQKLSEQIERIKAFYDREGIVGTEVYVDEEDLPEWGGVVLTFNIRRGANIRYRSIEVTGNAVFPRGRFISAINRFRQYSDKRLSESLRKLKETYAKHGYPHARIKIASKHIDFEKNRIDLKLDVTEGQKVKIVFKGAAHVSQRLLKKTITIMREGSTDEYEIEESAKAVNNLLVERGYPGVETKTTKIEEPDGTIVIIFDIDSGSEQKIKRITFAGNENVSGSDLAAGIKNREESLGRSGAFSPEDIPADDDEIKKAFRRKGFLDAKVGEWIVEPTKQGYALDLTIPVEEGRQTIVGEISFHGNHAFRIAELLKELKIRPGKPFDEPGLENDRARLITFYTDNGYPYCEIKQSWHIDETTQMANVAFDISEGIFVRIGNILFVGDVLTSQKAIRNAMDIHEGDPFSLKKIINSQLNIRRLGPFAFVNIETIGIEEREPIVHLKVKVEEQRPFMLDLGISYSTYEGFTGSLSFTNVNAFGWAKSNSLKIIAGQRLARAEIGWLDPRFLSSSFEMSALGWLQYKQRPSYAYTQAAGSFGWLRRFRRFGFSFRYELNRNYFVTGDSVAADADSLRNNNISRISLSSSYDSRDSFSDPKKGFYTLGSIDIFNEIKGNEANFVKFTWEGENDLSFLKLLTLSSAVRINRIETVGSNVSVPTNELYFLGGNDTIRGFAEDSLGPQDANGKATGARSRWIFNEELRLRLWRSLSWAFFYDMGSLTNNFSDVDAGNVRKAFGMGLRYVTPVGPIRAEYGFKLDRKTNESRGRFHFTFGYVF